MIFRSHQVCKVSEELTLNWERGFWAIPVKGHKYPSPKERVMHKSSTADKLSVWTAQGTEPKVRAEVTRKPGTEPHLCRYKSRESWGKGWVALGGYLAPCWARDSCWATPMGSED